MLRPLILESSQLLLGVSGEGNRRTRRIEAAAALRHGVIRILSVQTFGKYSKAPMHGST